HNELYKRAKQEASSHESQITQIDEAEARIKLLRTKVAKTQEAIDAFGPVENGFKEGRLEWLRLYQLRAEKMQAKCAELTALSEQRIRSHLSRGVGIDKIKGRLLGLVTGTKLRTKKIDDLCDIVSKAVDPASMWSEIIAEMEVLIDYSGTD